MTDLTDTTEFIVNVNEIEYLFIVHNIVLNTNKYVHSVV